MMIFQFYLNILAYYCNNFLLLIKDQLKWFSATMYFNNTAKAHELVDSWIRLNKLFPKNWDQVNLQNALNEINDIKVVRLPPEYNFITDLSREYYGNLKPVFEQYQASRKYKKRLNRS